MEHRPIQLMLRKRLFIFLLACFLVGLAVSYPMIVRFWYHHHVTCSWSYHWNGNLQEMSFCYLRGEYQVQHGPTITFYEDGHIASWREFKDGKRDGITILWDDDGNIIVVEFWRQGKLLSPPVKRKSSSIVNGKR